MKRNNETTLSLRPSCTRTAHVGRFSYGSYQHLPDIKGPFDLGIVSSDTMCLAVSSGCHYVAHLERNLSFKSTIGYVKA